MKVGQLTVELKLEVGSVPEAIAALADIKKQIDKSEEAKTMKPPIVISREYAAALVAAASVELKGSVASEILWCCHARGPDEVYAAPDYETALRWSDHLNRMNFVTYKHGLQHPTAVSSYDAMLVRAVPAVWPWSAATHADELSKSIAGFMASASEKGG